MKPHLLWTRLNPSQTRLDLPRIKPHLSRTRLNPWQTRLDLPQIRPHLPRTRLNPSRIKPHLLQTRLDLSQIRHHPWQTRLRMERIERGRSWARRALSASNPIFAHPAYWPHHRLPQQLPGRQPPGCTSHISTALKAGPASHRWHSPVSPGEPADGPHVPPSLPNTLPHPHSALPPQRNSPAIS